MFKQVFVTTNSVSKSRYMWAEKFEESNRQPNRHLFVQSQ